MFTLKISSSLSRKLLKTNKCFICYNLTDDRTQIDSYILTNDLYRYKNRYSNFKAISCIKKQFNTITLTY
jgi:hypothetical protein